MASLPGRCFHSLLVDPSANLFFPHCSDVEVDTTSPMHLAIRQADFANQISNALNAGAAKCQPHCNNIKNVCKTGKSAAAITAVVKVELQAIIVRLKLPRRRLQGSLGVLTCSPDFRAYSSTSWPRSRSSSTPTSELSSMPTLYALALSIIWSRS